MKNNLLDLHNHLFAAIEKVMDDDLTDAEFTKAVVQARTISVLAERVTNLGGLMAASCRLAEEISPDIKIPSVLLDKENENLMLSARERKTPLLLLRNNHDTA